MFCWQSEKYSWDSNPRPVSRPYHQPTFVNIWPYASAIKYHLLTNKSAPLKGKGSMVLLSSGLRESEWDWLGTHNWWDKCECELAECCLQCYEWVYPKKDLTAQEASPMDYPQHTWTKQMLLNTYKWTNIQLKLIQYQQIRRQSRCSSSEFKMQT